MSHTLTMTTTTTENMPVDNSCSGRIWADGCYDMSHFGHANSLRQAKNFGNYLIVGVHSDADIEKHKGTPPVFTQEERYAMIRAIKGVDEVVEASPYVTTLETLAEHNCDLCAHGDDPTTTDDGTDTYHKVRAANKYKEYKRTQGVSTTKLINRGLDVVRHEDDKSKIIDTNNNLPPNPNLQQEDKSSPWTGNSTPVLLTTNLISLFATNNQPSQHDKIIYVAGAFDVFHMGHLQFLEKARKLGTYLIVGLHSDEIVSSYCGSKYPIMPLNVRMLNLLGCKYVNDVVVGAPLVITKELLDHLKIDVVVHGGQIASSSTIKIDPYDEPRQRNILHEIQSGSTLKASDIVQRIRDRRSEYEERNRKKEEKERKIYEEQQAQLNTTKT